MTRKDKSAFDARQHCLRTLRTAKKLGKERWAERALADQEETH